MRASPNRRIHPELDMEIALIKKEWKLKYGIKLSTPQASRIILKRAMDYKLKLRNNDETFLPKI